MRLQVLMISILSMNGCNLDLSVPNFEVPDGQEKTALAPVEPTAELPGGVATIRVKIPPSVFYADAMVTMTIANDEDIEASERNQRAFGSCWVTQNAVTGEEETSCTNGFVYDPEPVRTQTHEIKASDIDGEWVVETDHLVAGGRYSIGVSGLSSDRCNSASGGDQGVVTSPEIFLEPNFSSTLRACLLPEDMGPINVLVQIPNGLFHKDGKITLRIYSGKETAASAPESGEVHEISVTKLADTRRFWVIATEHVTRGGDFEIQISGLNSDNCNTTSSTAKGVVPNTLDSTIELTNLFWATTKKGCVP